MISKKLLVISDNPELCIHLQSELVKNFTDKQLDVSYRFTRLNQNPIKMIEIGASKIDIKDESTVDFVLNSYDLVFSIHCKQIFPVKLVKNICCVNFHPGFNPFNRGWFPQAFSIINGYPAGATIHLMDEHVDHGEIIAQETVSIQPSDTSYEVYRRVIDVEKKLISKYIYEIVTDSYKTFKPSGDGNYNGIKDYQSICQLNLNDIDSLENHINLLRSTTHENFRNAFFVAKDGKKYFIRILIEPD